MKFPLILERTVTGSGLFYFIDIFVIKFCNYRDLSIVLFDLTIKFVRYLVTSPEFMSFR